MSVVQLTSHSSPESFDNMSDSDMSGCGPVDGSLGNAHINLLYTALAPMITQPISPHLTDKRVL